VTNINIKGYINNIKRAIYAKHKNNTAFSTDKHEDLCTKWASAGVDEYL
jgi:hypothetical protein